MKKTTLPPDSPVVKLLRAVWGHANEATGHSWERLNHAMHKALQLAIGAGFPFDADDFRLCYERFRGSYWMGASDEWAYSQAVAEGNLSAAKAFEERKGRKPIIGDEVESHGAGGSYKHGGGNWQRQRLHVGCTFRYQGERLKVTSFSQDGTSLVACSYHPLKQGEYGDKIKQRYTITSELIQADRKARKKGA